MSMKNFSDTIGNRTRDIPTCSAVPQPTVLPRAGRPARLRPTALLPPRSNGKTRGCYCSCWAPDDGREDARNMLSCTYTSSNKLEELLHLVGWFIRIPFNNLRKNQMYFICLRKKSDTLQSLSPTDVNCITFTNIRHNSAVFHWPSKERSLFH